ncbi:MAG: M90 family metallopeptidase, partial [Dyella sp.]
MASAWWSRLRNRFQVAPIDALRWRTACAACPLAQRLSAPQRARLRQLSAQFLANKHFEPIDPLALDSHWQLLIAMQACLPLLQPGPAALHGWSTVVVYPGQFRVRRPHYDAFSGVMSENTDVLIGEAWPHGPLVLSLADLQRDLIEPWKGRNLIVHEMAHKLDMLDGPPDGVPPLPADLARKPWIEVFQRAYDQLVEQVAQGLATPIDSYAAHNPAEYFAVVSELHYSQPALLREHAPAV